MQPILDTILGHAESRGNQPAILGVMGESIDYASLYQQIQNFGGELKRRGIGRQDRIAVVLPDGPEMAVAFLAISAYCTCAPLNTAYKERDFAFYLDDLEAKALILAEGQPSPSIQEAEARGIPVWRLQAKDEGSSIQCTLKDSTANSENLDSPNADDIAMILHTSGTTSRPKMVPLSQANLASSAANVAETLQLVPEDRGLVVMPLFHIHGLVGALLSAIHAGSSIVCTPGFNGASFFGWAHEFSATWYSAVPTMHQALLQQAKVQPDEAKALMFRVVRSSSASLPPKVFHDLETLWEAPVIESYGMTEAAHQMTSNPMPPAVQKPGSVGLPAGPEVAIFGESGEFLKPGKTGAIVIRGDNVTAGYAKNPEANKTAFTNGWFETGDQGYFDDEGYLILTGRLKEMINRGGENIAPREVDEVLLEHPAVAQATAFAIPHESLGEDLAAAVVLKDASEVQEGELRHFVSERLAPFKVPNRIVFVQSIPKGPTGKLQRIGLHEKLSEYLIVEYKEPRNETESMVEKIISDILNRKKTGVEDNFFFLGGDSLKAARVVAALSNELSTNYPVNLIFKNPTVELIAAYLEKEAENKDDDLDLLAKELSALSPEEIEQLLADDETT